MASLRDKLESRLGNLKSVRQDFEAEVRDIARFAQPARSRFLSSDQNKGGKRRQQNKRLLDPHGVEASRTLTNGMTSGLSSASRPWFTLGLQTEAMADKPGARDYLSAVERELYSFLAAGNFYGSAKSGYAENGLFGTEAAIMREHRLYGMVCHPLTFGEYWIAINDALVPDTLYRWAGVTVRQAVEQFGDKVSTRVRTMYDASNYDQQLEIYHAIEPDPEHNPFKLGSKPWRSVYWDQQEDADKIIVQERGFHEKPFWAARWDVVGGDTYGVSPGMEALPALRELQMQTKRRNEAIDFNVKPEKIVPPGLRLTGQAGNIVSAASIDKDSVLVPFKVEYQTIAAIGTEIDKCQGQIDRLFFADLFNAITNMRGVQPRNVEEIAARNEEKLTQLGPVIERVNNEKLGVVIDRAFGIMSRGGLLPDPPEEMGGEEIKVEFVSILAQMQRMVGLGQIERTVGFIGGLAGAFPEAVDKLDVDEMIDEYAYRAGAPAKIIRDADAVSKIREARAAQQSQQQAVEAMPAVRDGADAARLLSETDAGGSSLLDQMMPG